MERVFPGQVHSYVYVPNFPYYSTVHTIVNPEWIGIYGFIHLKKIGNAPCVGAYFNSEMCRVGAYFNSEMCRVGAYFNSEMCRVGEYFNLEMCRVGAMAKWIIHTRTGHISVFLKLIKPQVPIHSRFTII